MPGLSASRVRWQVLVWASICLPFGIAQSGSWLANTWSAPEARAYAAAACDDTGARFYVLGGYSHAYAKCMEDGWVLAGRGGASQLSSGSSSWSKLPAPSPAGPIMGHTLTWFNGSPECQQAGCLVLIGGTTSCTAVGDAATTASPPASASASGGSSSGSNGNSDPTTKELPAESMLRSIWMLPLSGATRWNRLDVSLPLELDSGFLFHSAVTYIQPAPLSNNTSSVANNTSGRQAILITGGIARNYTALDTVFSLAWEDSTQQYSITRLPRMPANPVNNAAGLFGHSAVASGSQVYISGGLFAWPSTSGERVPWAGLPLGLPVVSGLAGAQASPAVITFTAGAAALNSTQGNGTWQVSGALAPPGAATAFHTSFLVGPYLVTLGGVRNMSVPGAQPLSVYDTARDTWAPPEVCGNISAASAGIWGVPPMLVGAAGASVTVTVNTTGAGAGNGSFWFSGSSQFSRGGGSFRSGASDASTTNGSSSSATNTHTNVSQVMQQLFLFGGWTLPGGFANETTSDWGWSVYRNYPSAPFSMPLGTVVDDEMTWAWSVVDPGVGSPNTSRATAAVSSIIASNTSINSTGPSSDSNSSSNSTGAEADMLAAVLSNGTWRVVAHGAPSARVGASLVAMTPGGQVLMFGGRHPGSVPTGASLYDVATTAALAGAGGVINFNLSDLATSYWYSDLWLMSAPSTGGPSGLGSGPNNSSSSSAPIKLRQIGGPYGGTWGGGLGATALGGVPVVWDRHMVRVTSNIALMLTTTELDGLPSTSMWLVWVVNSTHAQWSDSSLPMAQASCYPRIHYSAVTLTRLLEVGGVVGLDVGYLGLHGGLNLQFTEINLETGTGLALLTPTDSTCLYDLTNLKWLLPPTYPANSQPIPRYLHSCADWPHGNSLFCMVCFGGLDASNNILDDMIYFNVNANQVQSALDMHLGAWENLLQGDFTPGPRFALDGFGLGTSTAAIAAGLVDPAQTYLRSYIAVGGMTGVNATSAQPRGAGDVWMAWVLCDAVLATPGVRRSVATWMQVFPNPASVPAAAVISAAVPASLSLVGLSTNTPGSSSMWSLDLSSCLAAVDVLCDEPTMTFRWITKQNTSKPNTCWAAAPRTTLSASLGPYSLPIGFHDKSPGSVEYMLYTSTVTLSLKDTHGVSIMCEDIVPHFSADAVDASVPAGARYSYSLGRCLVPPAHPGSSSSGTLNVTVTLSSYGFEIGRTWALINTSKPYINATVQLHPMRQVFVQTFTPLIWDPASNPTPPPNPPLPSGNFSGSVTDSGVAAGRKLATASIHRWSTSSSSTHGSRSGHAVRHASHLPPHSRVGDASGHVTTSLCKGCHRRALSSISHQSLGASDKHTATNNMAPVAAGTGLSNTGSDTAEHHRHTPRGLARRLAQTSLPPSPAVNSYTTSSVQADEGNITVPDNSSSSNITGDITRSNDAGTPEQSNSTFGGSLHSNATATPTSTAGNLTNLTGSFGNANFATREMTVPAVVEVLIATPDGRLLPRICLPPVGAAVFNSLIGTSNLGAWDPQACSVVSSDPSGAAKLLMFGAPTDAAPSPYKARVNATLNGMIVSVTKAVDSSLFVPLETGTAGQKQLTFILVPPTVPPPAPSAPTAASIQIKVTFTSAVPSAPLTLPRAAERRWQLTFWSITGNEPDYNSPPACSVGNVYTAVSRTLCTGPSALAFGDYYIELTDADEPTGVMYTSVVNINENLVNLPDGISIVVSLVYANVVAYFSGFASDCTGFCSNRYPAAGVVVSMLMRPSISTWDSEITTGPGGSASFSLINETRGLASGFGYLASVQLPGLESVIQPLVQPQVVRPDPGKSSVSLALALPGQLMCLDDTPRVIEGESGTWPDSAVLNQVYYQPGVECTWTLVTKGSDVTLRVNYTLLGPGDFLTITGTGLSAHLSSPYNSTTTSWLEALHDSSLDHYDNITTNASMFVGYASGGNVTIRLISNADGVWGRAFQISWTSTPSSGGSSSLPIHLVMLVVSTASAGGAMLGFVLLWHCCYRPAMRARRESEAALAAVTSAVATAQAAQGGGLTVVGPDGVAGVGPARGARHYRNRVPRRLLRLLPVTQYTPPPKADNPGSPTGDGSGSVPSSSGNSLSTGDVRAQALLACSSGPRSAAETAGGGVVGGGDAGSPRQQQRAGSSPQAPAVEWADEMSQANPLAATTPRAPRAQAAARDDIGNPQLSTGSVTPPGPLSSQTGMGEDNGATTSGTATPVIAQLEQRRVRAGSSRGHRRRRTPDPETSPGGLDSATSGADTPVTGSARASPFAPLRTESGLTAGAPSTGAGTRGQSAPEQQDAAALLSTEGPDASGGSLLGTPRELRVRVTRSHSPGAGSHLLGAGSHSPGAGSHSHPPSGPPESVPTSSRSQVPGGLSAEANADVCSICLGEYEVGDLLRSLPCTHSFHVACIDQWLSRDRCCPLCKRDVIAAAAEGTPGEAAELAAALLRRRQEAAANRAARAAAGGTSGARGGTRRNAGTAGAAGAAADLQQVQLAGIRALRPLVLEAAAAVQALRFSSGPATVRGGAAAPAALQTAATAPAPGAATSTAAAASVGASTAAAVPSPEEAASPVLPLQPTVFAITTSRSAAQGDDLLLTMPPPPPAPPSGLVVHPAAAAAAAAGSQEQGAVQGEDDSARDADGAEIRPPTLGTWGQQEDEGEASQGTATAGTGVPPGLLPGGQAVIQAPPALPSNDTGSLDVGRVNPPAPNQGGAWAPSIGTTAGSNTTAAPPGAAPAGNGVEAVGPGDSAVHQSGTAAVQPGVVVVPPSSQSDRRQAAQALAQELAAMNAAIEGVSAQAAVLEAVTAAVASAAVLASPTGAQPQGITRIGSSQRRGAGAQPRASTPPGQRPGNRARAAALQQQQQSGSNSVRTSGPARPSNPLTALLSGAGWVRGGGGAQQQSAAAELLRSRSARAVTAAAVGAGAGGNASHAGGLSSGADGSAETGNEGARA